MPENLAPSIFLKSLLEKEVYLKLYNGSIFQGVLLSVDNSMNVALSESNETKPDNTKLKHGYTFIRGNNGILNLIF